MIFILAQRLFDCLNHICYSFSSEKVGLVKGSDLSMNLVIAQPRWSCNPFAHHSVNPLQLKATHFQTELGVLVCNEKE